MFARYLVCLFYGLAPHVSKNWLRIGFGLIYISGIFSMVLFKCRIITN